MTNILTIILFTISLASFGQSCDTIGGNLVNCKDAAGLRQGYWELTNKKVLFSRYGGLGSEEGCRYFEKVEYYPLARGQYEDDNKIGTWKYFSGDKLENLERKIKYFKNGAIKDNNLSDRYLLNISSDTTSINGEF